MGTEDDIYVGVQEIYCHEIKVAIGDEWVIFWFQGVEAVLLLKCRKGKINTLRRLNTDLLFLVIMYTILIIIEKKLLWWCIRIK